YKRSEIPDNNSVKTGRNLEEIAEQSEAAGNVWLPKQKKQDPKATQTRVIKTAKRKAEKTVVKKPVVAKKSEKMTNAKVDPLPRKNKPMIATNSRYAVSGTDWVFEPHLNGLRALAEVEGKRVFFYSKSGLPYEKKFPQIVEDLKSLDCTAVFDGEVITNKGKPFYVIYDLLYYKGKDLRKDSLRERKSLLEQLSPRGKNIGVINRLKKPEAISVAKNLKSFYKAGTSSDWLLVQTSATTPLKKNAREPKIAPTKVPLPKSSKTALKFPASNLEEARLTNLEKVFWPEEGITKGDLLEYYKSISAYILPYLLDRPESLNRQPNGIAAPGFYQKDMTGHIPRWLKTVRYFSESANKSIDYVLVQDERSLLYIVNLGCIEINPWFARIQKPNHPDFMVIDLDPDGNSFDHVIEIAHEVHKILDSVGASNFCKTSGATGIHIGVPTGAKYNFDEVREFAEMVCRIIAKKYPATTSIDRNPNRRKGKIYLDFMQNRRGQTLASAYCVRPKSGAPVSMPLSWSELKIGIKPIQFHMKNALHLISKRKDPWRGVLGSPIDLEKCRATLLKKYKV
ncbi:MAG: non-homologous end-joining DNA ligase, partial [Pseudobdellovibrionaceae bacterium]